MARRGVAFCGGWCAAAVSILAIASPAWSLPGDLDCSGSVTVDDVGAFVLALVDPAGYGTAYPGCDITQADMNSDGFEDGADIPGFVAELLGGGPTEPPTATQLAGNSLGEYPYFEFVKAFNEDATVEVAIDPSRFPDIVGETGDIYIVEARSPGGWYADPTLTDVSAGGPQTETFGGTTIQDNTFTITGPYELDSAVFVEATGDYTGLGHGYDIVLDMNQNGVLDTGDYIDGLGWEAGLYVVHDTTQPGPLAVTETPPYSVGTIFDIPSDHTMEVLYYPANIAAMEPRPLIVISHGSGHEYTWYDHIGHHMASYGYIVMSHQDHPVSTALGHTDAILELQDEIAGGLIDGKIDSSRIVWIGHSFGAISAVISYNKLVTGEYVPTHYTTDSIVLISSMLPPAPPASHGALPHNVNYHLWTASGDSQVSGSAYGDMGQTFQLYERATGWRMSTTVQGTGHAWFHTGTEPWGDWFEGPCSIGQENTHLIQLGLFLPLIKHFAEGNTPATDFFYRQYERFHPIGVDVSDPCIVVTNECRPDPANGAFFIDDYQSQHDAGTSSSGGTVTFTVQNLTEGRLDDNDWYFTWSTGDPFNGATQAGPDDDSRGVVFDWNDADRCYEWEVVPGARDFSQYLYISFRGAQGTQHPHTLAFLGDETFTLTLRDGTGVSSSIHIGAYGGGIEQPYQRQGGWHNEMEVIRIRPSDFLTNGSGLDLTDIVAVRFDFGPSWGSNEGRIVVDELMLTNDYPPYFVPMAISLPIAPPELIPPGTPTNIDVEIFEGNDTLLAGSALLHYRYDGETWQSVELEQIAGELWSGTLPAAGCDDEPEYYFSATGAVTGVIYAPGGGASTPYVSFVGSFISIIQDDFNSDLGWTVENIDLAAGAWERAVPSTDGSYGEPTEDYDGSGYCYVTANAHHVDVDGGPTILISPTIDLDGLTNPVLRYARWWANDDQDDDPMAVEISNDDGGTWYPVETVMNIPPGWVERSIYITNYVTPLTSQMKVRFSVEDNPSNSKDEGAIDAFEIFEMQCD